MRRMAGQNGRAKWSGKMVGQNGRNERIRTSDPLLPKQVRYQAALRSDVAGCIAGLFAVRNASAVAFFFRTHYQTALADGEWPSGKAAVFGTAIPRFESWRPSQAPASCKLNVPCVTRAQENVPDRVSDTALSAPATEFRWSFLASHSAFPTPKRVALAALEQTLPDLRAGFPPESGQLIVSRCF
jgi:hypothetical protein